MTKDNGLGLFFFLFTGFMLSNESGKAQTAGDNDSAFTAISKMKDDTVKIKMLFDLGYTLEETDTALCNKVYDEALNTSKKIKNSLYECKSLINKGILNITHGNYEAARNFYQLAFQVAVKTNNNEYIAKALGNIGNTYLYQDKFDDALKNYFEALKYLEQINDLRSLSLTYGNIAQIFSQQRLFENEMLYDKKALETALKLKENNTIGISYLNLALAYLHTKDSVKSFEASLAALNYLRNSPFKVQLATAYNNIASGYTDKKDYSKAMTYCDSAMQLFLSNGSDREIAGIYTLKSIIALRQKDFSASKTNIEKAKKYVQEADSWILWREWYLQMSNLEEAKGNYREALLYYINSKEFADSIGNEDLRKNTQELEVKFQNEKKQLQITKLENERELQALAIKQKSTFNALLAIGLLAAIIIGFLFYRNVKRSQQLAKQTGEIKDIRIKELEQEKQLVAVNSILKGQEAERSRMAKDLHDGLGGMLSGIKLNLSSMKGNMVVQENDANLFNKSLAQLDNAISEMRRVAHNMMPEALLKFGLNEAVQDYCDGINETNLVKMKFTHMGFAEPLQKPTEVILYRIIQELSNNALKHAVAKSIFIQLTKHERGITLTVEDDGKGFDTTELAGKRGAGLQNVQSRVDYLKGFCHIESGPGKGTSVNVEIPVENLA